MSGVFLCVSVFVRRLVRRAGRFTTIVLVARYTIQTASFGAISKIRALHQTQTHAQNTCVRSFAQKTYFASGGPSLVNPHSPARAPPAIMASLGSRGALPSTSSSSAGASRRFAVARPAARHASNRAHAHGGRRAAGSHIHLVDGGKNKDDGDAVMGGMD